MKKRKEKEKFSIIKSWIEWGAFLPITCINFIHIVLHAFVLNLLLSYDGITCYQDSYYLVLGGRILALAIACVATAISVLLFSIATKEICCAEPENGKEEPIKKDDGILTTSSQ